MPFAARLAFVAALAAAPASAQQAGDIVVEHAWARATPKGASVGVGYMTLRNIGRASDTLTSITSDAAGAVEMHETTMTGGVMRMDAVAALAIPPGQAIVFKPGGYHLMFVGLKAPFAKSAIVKATLVFEHAGRIALDFPVAGVGAGAPEMDMK